MCFIANRKSRFLLVVISWVSSVLFSQEVIREFKNISVENGLPHTKVNNILQDYLGYVWIATIDGLAKYDSYSFTVYKQNPEDSTTIGSNQIFALYEDNKNDLWIGAKNSLERYNRKKDAFESFCLLNANEKFTERLPVYGIKQYADSVYLFGTDGGGLYVFNPYENKYEQYKTIIIDDEKKSVTRIPGICIGQNNPIWLATQDEGLIEFDIVKEVFVSHKREFQRKWFKIS